MSNWLTTTLSVIAGGLLTMASAWLADRRLSERERERRREERNERLAARGNDFQRETLLALQVASQQLLRTTAAMNHLDVMAFRTAGEWRKQLLPDHLSDDYLRHITETMLLASRVRDEKIRTLADQLRQQVSAVIMSADEVEAAARITLAAETQQALIERIGQLLREMDAGEANAEIEPK